MISQLLSDLDAQASQYTPLELADHYGKFSGFRSNHVVDEDGSFVDSEGSSRGIANQTDRQLLISLRTKSDVVIVDAATARKEQYKGLRDNTLAIISKTGNFRDIPAVQLSVSKVVLLVPLELVDATTLSFARDNLTVIGFDSREMFDSIRASFKAEGFTSLLLETGPTLTKMAINQNALSQACVTQTFVTKTPQLEDLKFPFPVSSNSTPFKPRFVGSEEKALYSLWELSATAWL